MNQDKSDNNEHEIEINPDTDTQSHDDVEQAGGAQASANTFDQDSVIIEDGDQGLDWKVYAEELEAKLSAAEATINGQKDAVLRAKADGENARRRAEQEVDKARKFALEKFAGDLLNVVDNLERATQSADPENEAVKSLLEGIELTHKSFITTFEKFGLEIVDPQGETFNPEHHQAMSMQESDDVAPNTVIAVMQKGYLLSGRLLRPAMVMVSRASSNGVDTQA